jgi:hypothetical protein
MTRFSGYASLPSPTIELLAYAAREHGLPLSRHAELCIIAGMKVISKTEHRIVGLAELPWRNTRQIHITLPDRLIEDICAKAHAEGVTMQALIRALLIHAVEGMALVDRPATPMPAASMFRTYKPARIIVERETRLGMPTFSMGDPAPGRSALDRKRAMEAGR